MREHSRHVLADHHDVSVFQDECIIDEIEHFKYFCPAGLFTIERERSAPVWRDTDNSWVNVMLE